MSEDLLNQIATQTGPLGGMIFAAAVWVRGSIRELGLRIDSHERRLDHLEEKKNA